TALGFNLAYISSALLIACLVTETTSRLPKPALDELPELSVGRLLLETVGAASQIVAIYVPIPWMPPVLWGIMFARNWRTHDDPQANLRMNAWAACIMLAAFTALRSAQGFGNITVDAVYPLNLTKYPPSLAFLLLTMSVNHALLALLLALPACPRLAAAVSSEYNPVMVFGRSALFFYVLHFAVYKLFNNLWVLGGVFPPGSGGIGGGREGMLSFWPFMANWIVGLGIVYPVCLWYGRFKGSKGADSIWRFF
ncbi:MAG: hypothetical protein SGCHY_000182, partial [Lobulomycetales sp.]